MRKDERYEHALAAALVVLGEIDKRPGMAKHNLLALLVFSIMHAIESWVGERRPWPPEFSAN